MPELDPLPDRIAISEEDGLNPLPAPEPDFLQSLLQRVPRQGPGLIGTRSRTGLSLSLEAEAEAAPEPAPAAA